MKGDIVRDHRVGNAILRRAGKALGFPDCLRIEMHPKFSYIDGVFYYAPDGECYCVGYGPYRDELSKKFGVYIKTEFYGVEYKGKRYRSQYFDGCFSPFIVEQ